MGCCRCCGRDETDIDAIVSGDEDDGGEMDACEAGNDGDTDGDSDTEETVAG